MSLDTLAPYYRIMEWVTDARAVLRLMYVFLRFSTGLSAARLTPPDGFLKAAGFRLLASFVLIHSDLWQRVKQ